MSNEERESEADSLMPSSVDELVQRLRGNAPTLEFLMEHELQTVRKPEDIRDAADALEALSTSLRAYRGFVIALGSERIAQGQEAEFSADDLRQHLPEQEIDYLWQQGLEVGDV